MRGVIVSIICALALGASTAQAQEFPTGTVRLLVPFAAGGPTDVVTRILAELLSARWGGKTVLVENRPGAGTILMTTAVAKAPPDGHTLGMATNSLLINPAIGMKLPYDTFKEITGVSMVATQPVALVANKDFPANTLAEVVALAKKAGEPTNYTSPDAARPGRCVVGGLGDLLRQRDGLGQRVRRKVLVRHQRDGLRRHHADAGDLLKRIVGQLHADRQIGRASCRERV